MLIIFFSSFDSKFIFWTWKFCSSKSAKFEKKLQKVLALSFVTKETTLFSFNDILYSISSLEGIPTDFEVRQSSLGLFVFSAIFCSKRSFSLLLITFLSKSFAHLKLSLSIFLPNILNFL